MSPENPTTPDNKGPITPDEIREQTIKSFGVPSGLGRRERRILERAQKKARVIQSIPKISEVHMLGDLDNLLVEEDLAVCRQGLGEYEYSRDSTKLNFELYRVYQAAGVPESSIHTATKRTLN